MTGAANLAWASGAMKRGVLGTEVPHSAFGVKALGQGSWQDPKGKGECVSV